MILKDTLIVSSAVVHKKLFTPCRSPVSTL